METPTPFIDPATFKMTDQEMEALRPGPLELVNLPADEIVQIYELRFKTKGYAKDMPFEATSLGEAIRMAKDWCLINGYMFINVSPFCHDIAGDLKKHRRASGL